MADTFCDILKKERLDRHKTQKEIADVLGVSVQSYSTFENGREPNYTKLLALAEYFGVTTDYLLGKSPYRRADDAPIANQFGIFPAAAENLRSLDELDIVMVNGLLGNRAFPAFVKELGGYAIVDEVIKVMVDKREEILPGSSMSDQELEGLWAAVYEKQMVEALKIIADELRAGMRDKSFAQWTQYQHKED